VSQHEQTSCYPTLAACSEYNCHADITLKDVETVQHEPERLRRWVAITRQTIEEVYG
jgi:hypothetical protein